MDHNYQHRKSWNEFQWEEEIRRDEQRISSYFRELAGCLDLPGEEELILNNISSNSSDPVIHNWMHNEGNSWSEWGDEESDDEKDNEETPSNHADDAIIDMVDVLAASWNMLMVTSLRKNLFCDGLGIACAYGKLLARLRDYSEVDEEYSKPLKVSLGKRALGDISYLLCQLPKLAAEQKKLQSSVDKHSGELLQVRDELLDRLEQLRTS